MSRNRQAAYFVANCIIILFIMIVLTAICIDAGEVGKDEILMEPIESTTVGTVITTPSETISPEMPTPETTAPPIETTPPETTIPIETQPTIFPPEILPQPELGEGCVVYTVPEKYNVKDFKSYESWKSINVETSPHYRLQREYAYTGEDGIRMVNERYCIALGSYFTETIGQYVDVILQNGTVISCILGDQKSDSHTDDFHIAHRSDGSIVEFIVDLKSIDSLAKKMGSMSYAHSEWRSPVVKIIVYDYNFFDEL